MPVMGRGSHLRASPPKKPTARVTVSLESAGRSGSVAPDLLGKADPVSARLLQLLKSGKATLVVARIGSAKRGLPIASVLGHGKRAHLVIHLPLEGPFLGAGGKRILRDTVKRLAESWVEALLKEAGKLGAERRRPGRVLRWRKPRAKP
jgi:hypothetical protein